MNGGVQAGKAFVEFILSDKRFASELDSLAGKMRKFGSIGTAVSGPIVAAFAGAAVQFAKTGAALFDTTQRLGETAEEISSLSFVAEQSGSSSEVLEKSLFAMNRKLDEAASGSKSAAESFTRLGLSVSDLQRMSPAERFRTIADAMRGLESDTAKAAIAQDIFGKGGRELLPVLNQGSTAIAAMQAEARRLGVTLTDEDAAAADKLDDALVLLWNQVKSLSLQVGAAIAGPLTEFVTWASEILAWVIAFIKENPNLVAAIAAIATGIAAASAAAVAFGVVLAVISAHPIIAALTAISALVLGLATYFGFASSGAKDFRKELDAIKAPGGAKAGVDAARRAQAEQVKRDLQSALAAGQSVPTERASRESAGLISEGMDEVVRWTKATAEACSQLVTLAREGGGLPLGTG